MANLSKNQKRLKRHKRARKNRVGTPEKGEALLKDAGGGVVGVLAYLFYLPMSFIVPSSSGLAAATMPVIAPIADLVGSSKEVMVGRLCYGVRFN